MARTKNNGNGHLDEAMAALVRAQASLVEAHATLAQAQAAFVARHAETEARMADLEREYSTREAASQQRFARIEGLLLDHSRILQALPDVIRDKIGFKAP